MASLKLKKQTSNYADLIDIQKDISIGRNFDNNIIIRSNNVSRHHCLITIDENKDVFVQDLNSKNGTFINNKKIDRIQAKHNDTLQVGNESFVFISSEDFVPEEIKPKFNLKSILLKGHFKETINSIILRSFEDSSTEFRCPCNSIYTLGRLQFCDIFIKDSSVSRTHATIDVREIRVVITDTNSTNGTYVNNQLVTQKELADGDVIRLGESKFIVSFDTVSNKRFTSLAQSKNMLTIDLLADYDNIINIYKSDYENHILLEVERQSLLFCQEFEQLFRTHKNLNSLQNSIINFTALISRSMHVVYAPTLKSITQKKENTITITSEYIQRTVNIAKERKQGNIFYFEEIAADYPTEIQMNGIAVTVNNEVKLLLFGIPYENLLYLMYAASWMSHFSAIINETV